MDLEDLAQQLRQHDLLRDGAAMGAAFVVMSALKNGAQVGLHVQPGESLEECVRKETRMGRRVIWVHAFEPH